MSVRSLSLSDSQDPLLTSGVRPSPGHQHSFSSNSSRPHHHPASLPITPDFLLNASSHLSNLFSYGLSIDSDATISFPNFSADAHFKTIVSATGNHLTATIFHFMALLDSRVHFSSGEILYLTFLVERAVCLDLRGNGKIRSNFVNHSTFSTLLITSAMLSLKYLRDIAPSTKWWSIALNTPASVLSMSERAFLQHIDFRMEISKENYDLLLIHFHIMSE